jgi:hypothetical protein
MGGGRAVLVDVDVALGVGDSTAIVGVNVGVDVRVAVNGRGDGGMTFVTVAVACGTNSTKETDKAPTTKPAEIKATTSALPKSRKRIISFLWFYYFFPQIYR